MGDFGAAAAASLQDEKVHKRVDELTGKCEATFQSEQPSDEKMFAEHIILCLVNRMYCSLHFFAHGHLQSESM